MTLRYLAAIGISLLAIVCALLAHAGVDGGPGPSLSSEADAALRDLHQRLQEMDQKVRSLEAELAAAHRSGAGSHRESPGEPEWLVRIESELAELEQVHSVRIEEDDELRREWLSESRVAREAIERYQQLFLQADLSAKTRGQALEMLARFPSEARVLNDAVMHEIRRLLVHGLHGPGPHGAVTLALTKHDHPFAREMLVHVARYGPQESVRCVALRGMQRWKDDPEVAALLVEKMNSGSERERNAAIRGSGRTIPRTGPQEKRHSKLPTGK